MARYVGTAILGQTVNESKLTLGEHTQRLVRNRARDVTIEDIVEGTGLSRHFIDTFINGHIANPSVHKVQKLYEFITGKRLEY